MPDDLIFYTHPMSRGRIARWMLEEVGQPYRTEIVEFGPAMKSPEYLAVNPMGKVPALRHGEAVVTECPAICAYLADAFPQARLAPAPGDKARAAYLRWMFFAAGPMEAALSNKSMGFEIPADMAGRSGYGASHVKLLEMVEQAVTQAPYFAGEHFSAADVYVGSHIGWGVMMGNIDKRPAFDAYLGRVMSRPAALKARQIDDALMAERKAAG